MLQNQLRLLVLGNARQVKKLFIFSSRLTPVHLSQDIPKLIPSGSYLSSAFHVRTFPVFRFVNLPVTFGPGNLASEEFDEMSANKFACDYARLGTSSCKKCKQKLDKGSLRLAKLSPSPFSEDGDMKMYYHPKCLFETFLRARATTKVIEEPDDVEGFQDLNDSDKDLINDLIKEFCNKKGSPKKTTQNKAPTPASKATPPPKNTAGVSNAPPSHAAGSSNDAEEKDNSFRQFRKLCADLAEENGYNGKTAIVERYITDGVTGSGFQGDLYLLLKLLLARVIKVVYNLESKQLAKHFSQIFRTNLDEMVEDLEQGDVAETVRVFFERSRACPPQTKSTLSIQDVDALLDELSQYTRDDDQQKCLTKIAKRCTSNDLKMIVRLIKHDLRINCGAKHILDALDPNAYEAFKASRNLRDVVDRVTASREAAGRNGLAKKLSIRANLMTPVQPMLAEACKSVAQAFKRCPNGMYAEIKYDGERVQVHKQGNNFLYYSRSLKPVQPHKVQHFREFIPQAFPSGSDLILDSEVLLIDTKTSKPLPFGSLGVHKKAAFQDANVCLFVFDCLHYNGENLMQKPIKERRKILRHSMVEIPNRILFSEMKHITDPDDLSGLMMKVFREGLEGLVLKDVDSVYEPGKRHWLKVKKDYLAEGAMADSADLVVLGAYFGTGNKGGIMSIFLMGVYDSDNSKWCTVTKCGNGFDDKTLDKLQKSLAMVKISKDPSKVPSWLNVTKTLIPDFVASDPKKSQVWEITGAEFSKSDSHTAAGISIRFPRCTKMRDDKTWKEATDLKRLRELFAKSKEYSDIPDVLSRTPRKGKRETEQSDDSDEEDEAASPTRLGKRKAEDDPSGVPTKTGKKDDSRPACKYGASCYQKNPEHRKAFSHPDDNDVASGNNKTSSSTILPSIFGGLKFYVPGSLNDSAKLRRYIVAYDGDLVESFDRKNATHVVIETLEGDDKSGHCVSAEWVWSCIKAKKLIPKTA